MSSVNLYDRSYMIVEFPYLTLVVRVPTTVGKTENEVVPLITSTETSNLGSVWQKNDLEDIPRVVSLAS